MTFVEKRSAEFWSEEVGFIRSQFQRKYPSEEFNCDRACLRRYAEMQANSARREGFPTAARTIDSYRQTSEAPDN